MRTQKPAETVCCQEIKKTSLGLLTQEDAKILLTTRGSNSVRAGMVRRQSGRRGKEGQTDLVCSFDRKNCVSLGKQLHNKEKGTR